MAGRGQRRAALLAAGEAAGGLAAASWAAVLLLPLLPLLPLLCLRLRFRQHATLLPLLPQLLRRCLTSSAILAAPAGRRRLRNAWRQQHLPAAAAPVLIAGHRVKQHHRLLLVLVLVMLLLVILRASARLLLALLPPLQLGAAALRGRGRGAAVQLAGQGAHVDRGVPRVRVQLRRRLGLVKGGAGGVGRQRLV